MLCANCGKDVQERSRFCPYCGANVGSLPDSRTQREPVGRGNNAKPPQPERRPSPGPRPTVGSRGPRRRRLLSFWQALIVLVIAMLVAGLLMAQPLNSAAKNIESGPLRALARVVTAPIAAVSGLLRIDKFYEWANGETAEVASTDTTESANTTYPTTTTGSTTTESTTTTDGGTSPGTTTTTAGTPVFTAEEPLKIFLAGDSLMIEVGHAFTRKSESLTSVDLYRINKVSSGFASPEFYDWPKQLTKTVGEFKPDVTVMMLGGNEKVPMTIKGVKVQAFTEEWKAEYVKRVQAGIDITTNTGAIVVWIGMPIMRSDKFSETARTLNAMYEQICEDDPDAYYLDAYELFSDANGNYSAYLTDSDGDNQLVREGDGIHFTPAGGDRVVEAVLETLREHFTLE